MVAEQQNEEVVGQERPYSGVKRTERVAQRRDLFIEAGIKLIGTHGYHGTTMRMLTSETGLTNRYFYESFSNTEALLIACYEHLMQQFRMGLETSLITESNEVEESVRRGVRYFYSAMRDHQFAQITHSEILGVSPQVDAVYHNAMREISQLMIAAVFPEDQQPDEARAKELEYTGAALIGALVHTAVRWVKNRFDQPIDDLVEGSVKLIMGTRAQLIA